MSEEFKDLWAMVLIKAFEDLNIFLNPDVMKSSIFINNRNIRDDAARWFFKPDHEVGSYLWICDILGVCPEALRFEIARKTSLVEIYRALRRRERESIRSWHLQVAGGGTTGGRQPAADDWDQYQGEQKYLESAGA